MPILRGRKRKAEFAASDLRPVRRHLDVIPSPEFHLAVHQAECAFLFPHGLTDGEAVERSWAESNTYPASTRQMGPGARRDNLDDDDMWARWNAAVGRLGDAMEDVVEPIVDSSALDTYVEHTPEVPDREWAEADPRDPDPFSLTSTQYRRMCAHMDLLPKPRRTVLIGPKVKLFAAPVADTIKMEEID
ncbi:hypothetical protein DFH06DRAFT_1128881 [Mycena polygramma]|nr:hypothetical protein DFH06DRAFT_1128881 [Mycena polygramma]